jgi:ArsR family transcriptional regulator
VINDEPEIKSRMTGRDTSGDSKEEAVMDGQIDLEELRERADEVSGLLKLLANPNRLLVACELMEGERSVSEIEGRTGVRQPNLSRDLARLRAEGLVTTRRESKQVFYALADTRIQALMEALCAAFGADLKTPDIQEQQP